MTHKEQVKIWNWYLKHTEASLRIAFGIGELPVEEEVSVEVFQCVGEEFFTFACEVSEPGGGKVYIERIRPWPADDPLPSSVLQEVHALIDHAVVELRKFRKKSS